MWPAIFALPALDDMRWFTQPELHWRKVSGLAADDIKQRRFFSAMAKPELWQYQCPTAPFIPLAESWKIRSFPEHGLVWMLKNSTKLPHLLDSPQSYFLFTWLWPCKMSQ